MVDISEIVTGFRNEAEIDFIDLPHIASTVQYDLGVESQQEIRDYALQVVKGLVERGVYPGDYTLETLERDEFQFLPGTPEELLKHIESEWIALAKTPTLFEPICWFALRPSKAA